MRASIFILLLCSLLFGGRGLTLYAAEHPAKISHITSQKISKSHPVKFIHKNKNSILLGENDIDLDEEFNNSDDLNDEVGNKVFFQKSCLLDKWYLSFPSQVFLNDFSKSAKIFMHFCGYSNPIYILQRVLRI